MKYVIGIDSGGTKFLVKACDLAGRPLAEHIGVPAPHHRYSIVEAKKRIQENIDRCLSGFGGKREDCAYIVCGTTGVDTEADRNNVAAIYETLEGFRCPILVVNDAEVAHFAVTGGIGAVVIAGTGSVAFGRNAQGRTTRSGGWPPCIFGDEGSGTWMSYKALHHLSLWFDERVPSTPLSDQLIDCLKLTKKEQLIEICIRIERFEWDNPGLAFIVDRTAREGDPYACGIVREAAEHTFQLADSIVRKLELHREPVFTVGAWGSAIVNNPLHLASFKEKFESKYENVQVRVADQDAADGACRMALQALKKGM